MFTIIEIILWCSLTLLVSYLCILSLFALFSSKPRLAIPGRLRKFAVVVPAHNEELSIEKTIRSIRDADYPPSLFDVVVVADNCSDKTASVGRRASAVVLERTDPANRGKGYALEWGFEKALLSPENYEAVVVIDADSVVTKNLLWVLNSYLEEGYLSVQIADVAATNPGNWTSEVTRIALTLYNVVLPLGRKVIGCSAGLRGNGMCFSVDVLERVPWRAFSLTEDLEFGLQLLMQGIPTVFCPEAKVIATMPSIAKNAESQRARWETGRIPVMRRYLPLLFKSAILSPSWRIADALIDLVTPAFANIVGVVSAIVAVKTGLSLLGVAGLAARIEMWCVSLALCGVYVFSGLLAADSDPSLYRATLYLPRYLMWKISLYVKLLLKGATREWVRTTRETEMTQP